MQNVPAYFDQIERYEQDHPVVLYILCCILELNPKMREFLTFELASSSNCISCFATQQAACLTNQLN